MTIMMIWKLIMMMMMPRWMTAVETNKAFKCTPPPPPKKERKQDAALVATGCLENDAVAKTYG